MPVTVEELKKVLRDEFPDADVDGIVEKDHRVSGTIVWNGFKKKESEERYRLIREKVRDKFGLKGLNIGILFGLAPGEKL